MVKKVQQIEDRGDQAILDYDLSNGNFVWTPGNRANCHTVSYKIEWSGLDAADGTIDIGQSQLGDDATPDTFDDQQVTMDSTPEGATLEICNFASKYPYLVIAAESNTQGRILVYEIAKT